MGSTQTDPDTERSVEAVRSYWDEHPLGRQYAQRSDLQPGTSAFFAHIRPWMNPFKFPWIMDRIEAESRLLRGKLLLEIGCGMGFDSVEFIRRGVRVVATDLSTAAVELAGKHFASEGLRAEGIQVENALALSFPEATFDAVWANGVLHHTGDTPRAIREIRRVLKPGGRAILSHFYRYPSWMYWISRVGREPIEFRDGDPPAIDFFREREILAMFDGFAIESTAREHHRALPVARRGWKAALYSLAFRPVYNAVPDPIARRLAYKFSVTAVKI